MYALDKTLSISTATFAASYRQRNLNALHFTSVDRAGRLRHNMYKHSQTSHQALATVADDERVGRIDYQSLDTVQRSHLGDIH